MEKVISKAEETSVFVLSNRSLSHVPNEVYYAASSKLCDTRFLGNLLSEKLNDNMIIRYHNRVYSSEC